MTCSSVPRRARLPTSEAVILQTGSVREIDKTYDWLTDESAYWITVLKCFVRGVIEKASGLVELTTLDLIFPSLTIYVYLYLRFQTVHPDELEGRFLTWWW